MVSPRGLGRNRRRTTANASERSTRSRFRRSLFRFPRDIACAVMYRPAPRPCRQQLHRFHPHRRFIFGLRALSTTHSKWSRTQTIRGNSLEQIDGNKKTWDIKRAAMPEATTLSGAAMRLANLGYLSIEALDDVPLVRDAITSFQRDAGLPPTATLDATTADKLVSIHGS